MPLDINQIKVLSITTGETPRDMSGAPNDWIKILFQVGPGVADIPVYFLKDRVSDADLIRVARHNLHQVTQAIADATKPWRLTEEDAQTTRRG